MINQGLEALNCCLCPFCGGLLKICDCCLFCESSWGPQAEQRPHFAKKGVHMLLLLFPKEPQADWGV